MPNMRATDFDLWMETAVGEVLESMCFLSAVGQVSTEICDADSVACRLNFIGDPNGSFGVRAPGATSRLIAANFLGEDEQELSSEQVVGDLRGHSQPPQSDLHFFAFLPGAGFSSERAGEKD